ncbi:MAG: hypothetical protein ACLU9S_00025 [Oscillospiraceae bacterium]
MDARTALEEVREGENGMSMDLARKTFSCEPEYFIAGTNIRIATAVKEAGADLSAHTPDPSGGGASVTPVAEAAKLTGLYGVTAEAAKRAARTPSSTFFRRVYSRCALVTACGA